MRVASGGAPGAGALVALHGFALGPGLWDELRAARPEWAWHTPWLPGHGPDGTALRGDFEAICASFGATLPAGVWMGYSMGARVALQAALAHPERVSALVLIGGNAAGARGDASRRAFDERWAERIERDGVEAFAEAWEQLPVVATRAPGAERLAAMRRAHRAPALASAMRCLGRGAQPDLRGGLAALPCPVHWLVGGDDAGALAEARALAEPGRLHVAEGVGHNVVVDAPEAVLALGL